MVSLVSTRAPQAEVSSRKGPATGPARTPRAFYGPAPKPAALPVESNMQGAAARGTLGPGPREPEHPRRRLRKHGGSWRGMERLRAEDKRWRSDVLGRRTASGACRRRPGPGRTGDGHQLRAYAFTSRTRALGPRTVVGEGRWRLRRLTAATGDVASRGSARARDSDEFLAPQF